MQLAHIRNVTLGVGLSKFSVFVLQNLLTLFITFAESDDEQKTCDQEIPGVRFGPNTCADHK